MKLKTVQGLSKALKILSTIAFVGAIVGCVMSVISIPLVAIFGNDPAVIDLFMQYEIEVNSRRMLCDCICVAVVCASMIALYYYTMKFYKTELQIGTPFDKRVVKGMRTIAILHLAIPFGTIIITSIISVCFGVPSLDIGDLTEIVIGIVYFVVAAILDYGADLRSAVEQPVEQPKEVEAAAAETNENAN